jgi:hypothetical protein
MVPSLFCPETCYNGAMVSDSTTLEVPIAGMDCA